MENCSAAQHLALHGWARLPNKASNELLHEIERVSDQMQIRTGTRLGLDQPEIEKAARGELAEAAQELLGEPVIPCRAILFEKSTESNWLVPWHQDVTLALPEKIELEGAGRWSQKEGMWHVLPPAAILQRMVALRVHLDPCTEEDGPLKVASGSHQTGLLTDEAVNAAALSFPNATLTTERGEILVMAPLCVHCSPKANGTSRRRVLHVEYCTARAYPRRIS